MDNRPIGVFDSGVGGLTVAKEIMQQLPNEKIIYFGDTARVPYGSKSKETVIKYSNQIIRFLLTKEVKAIVIACGTASSTALEVVKNSFHIPILGVVEPGARSAAFATRNNKVGIIGTEGTITSKTYDRLIHNHSETISVYGKACPLFVPLVEEGWSEDEVTIQIAKRYLDDLQDYGIDTLVLGCTHYPLLTNILGNIMGVEVQLVNPAYETAEELKGLLENAGIRSDEREVPYHEFYVSDRANKFETFAKRILNKPMMPVQQVQIEDY